MLAHAAFVQPPMDSKKPPLLEPSLPSPPPPPVESAPAAAPPAPAPEDCAGEELLHFHARLMSLPASAPFLLPVDPEALGIPDYHEFIRRPMDFGTVRARLQTTAYASVDDYAADVRLVFANSRIYNTIPNSPILAMTDVCEAFFEEGLPQLVAALPTLVLRRRGSCLAEATASSAPPPPRPAVRRSTAAPAPRKTSTMCGAGVASVSTPASAPAPTPTPARADAKKTGAPRKKVVAQVAQARTAPADAPAPPLKRRRKLAAGAAAFPFDMDCQDPPPRSTAAQKAQRRAARRLQVGCTCFAGRLVTCKGLLFSSRV